MSRVKVPFIWTSGVEPLVIRVSQSVVDDYYRELYKNRFDEGLGDFIHGHST